jgi:CDP-paratose 2-epimerase
MTPLRNILVTGGAGFVGCNLVERLLSRPETRVRVFDSLARAGVEHNLAWLQTVSGAERLDFVQGDVRDTAAVTKVARDATEIYHLAAQVAVTTSVDAPREDLEVNVVGTFNVLEAARHGGRNPYLLFTSTNKVYGSLEGVPVHVEGMRYRADEPAFTGVREDEALDFHSPYGCSKGAADQYVRDYGRIYGLPTTVFRMSCIAGPRQFGTEDQGWVAHFLYSVLEGRPITIYGDGFQVRDVLHVSDLVDAMEAAWAHRARTAGQIYNLGGGMDRAVSITEMLTEIERTTGRRPILNFSHTRPGDQPLYISDTSRLTQHTGWIAQRSRAEILESIRRFGAANRRLLTAHRESSDLYAMAELVREVVA